MLSVVWPLSMCQFIFLSRRISHRPGQRTFRRPTLNSAGSSDEGGRGDTSPRDWRWADAIRMARLAFES